MAGTENKTVVDEFMFSEYETFASAHFSTPENPSFALFRLPIDVIQETVYLD
jgi:hypothetical protein